MQHQRALLTIALIGATAASIAQTTAKLSDFDLSKAYGAKPLPKWQPPKVSAGTKKQLTQYARKLLDRAVRDAAKEKDLSVRAYVLGEAAKSYLLIDRKLARSTLKEAWAVTEKIKDDPGLAQTPLIEVWCGVDPRQARTQISKIKDKFRAEQARDSYAFSVGKYDFALAANLLEKQDAETRNRSLYYLAEEIFEDDPAAAIRLIRTVKNADHEKQLSDLLDWRNGLHVVEPLLPEIKSPMRREETLSQWILNLGSKDLERAAATALIIKDPKIRAEVCAHVAMLYVKKSPSKATFMSAESLAAIQRMPLNDQAFGRYLVVSKISHVDTPGVRKLLDQMERETLAKEAPRGRVFYSTIPSEALRVAGAWSHIDISRATDLVEKVLKVNPDAVTDRVHQYVNLNDGYSEYLSTIARTDPVKAADIIRPLLPKKTALNEGANDLGATGIAIQLLQGDPSKARAFAKALGNDWCIKEVENVAKRDKIKSDPAAALELLPKMDDFLMTDDFWEDQGTLGARAAQAFTVKGDLASARKLAAVVDNSYTKGQIFLAISWALLRKDPEKALQHMDLGFKAVQAEKEPGFRAQVLTQLAAGALNMAGLYHWKK